MTFTLFTIVLLFKLSHLNECYYNVMIKIKWQTILHETVKEDKFVIFFTNQPKTLRDRRVNNQTKYI